MLVLFKVGLLYDRRCQMKTLHYIGLAHVLTQVSGSVTVCEVKQSGLLPFQYLRGSEQSAFAFYTNRGYLLIMKGDSKCQEEGLKAEGLCLCENRPNATIKE